jgi:Family of unknown function (DUF5677)
MSGETLPPDAVHAIRIAACDSLLTYAIETAQSSGKANQDYGDAQFLVLSLFCRSTRTYEAIVRALAKRAFAEQIAMLNRSLFEDMVDAHWVHLNRQDALDRLVEHDRWSRHLRANVQREFADYFDGRKPPKQDLSDEEIAELRGHFGSKGGKSWTGVEFADRYKAILDYWEDDEQRRYMRWFNAWIHKLNNEIVHPSAFSLARLAAPQPTEEGGWEFRFGSTKEWLGQALSCAFWTYERTFDLVVSEIWEAEIADYQERIEEPFKRAFKAQLPEEEAADLGQAPPEQSS